MSDARRGRPKIARGDGRAVGRVAKAVESLERRIGKRSEGKVDVSAEITRNSPAVHDGLRWGTGVRLVCGIAENPDNGALLVHDLNEVL